MTTRRSAAREGRGDRHPRPFRDAARRSDARRALPGLALLAATVLSAAIPAALPAQTLRGTLRDGGRGGPVEDGTAELRTSGGTPVGRAVSDSAGTFVIEAPHPGLFILSVEAEGYVPPPGRFVQLVEGEETAVEIELRTRPFRLEPLEVTVQRRIVRLAETGFYDRRETGRGFFLGPEDLERRPPVTEVEPIIRAPFVFAEYGRGGTRITMRQRGGACTPALVIDDMEVRGGFVEDHVNFADIAAIEVYRGWWEVPPELALLNDCGVVMIWTTRRVGGGEGR